LPGALTTGDLPDVAGSLAPRPLRLEGLVDGLNRRVAAAAVQKTYEPAKAVYRAAKAEDHFTIGDGDGRPGIAVAQWILAQLKEK
jgi:hypothetical protein